MEKAAFIFDCDGTLIDTEDETIDSILAAMAGVDEPLPSRFQVKKHFGPGVDVILEQLLSDKSKVKKAYEIFLEHQQRVAPQMNVYRGIRSLLKTLKAEHHLLGLVTGRHEKDLENVLKAHELSGYFDIIIPDNILDHPKPDPQGLLKAASELNIRPDSIYYVGDMKTDIEAAKKAGTKSIAALWDKRVDEEVMRLEKPDLMARIPEDIIKMTMSENGHSF